MAFNSPRWAFDLFDHLHMTQAFREGQLKPLRKPQPGYRKAVFVDFRVLLLLAGIPHPANTHVDILSKCGAKLHERGAPVTLNPECDRAPANPKLASARQPCFRPSLPPRRRQGTWEFMMRVGFRVLGFRV